MSQILPLLFLPILSRVYDPGHFGELAIYMAITAILGAISCLRLELAIPIAQNQNELNNVIVSCQALVTFTTLTFAFIIFGLYFAAQQLYATTISIVYFLLPVSIYCTGIFNILLFFNTRTKTFNILSYSYILKSAFMVAIQVVFPVFFNAGYGLIFGFVAGQIIAVSYLILKSNYRFKFLVIPTLSRVVTRRYSNFIVYSTCSIFMNTFGQNLNNFLINNSYGISSVGTYSMSQRLLIFPSATIGNAISQVYIQRLSQIRGSGKAALRYFDQTLIILSMISVVCFLPIYYSAETLVSVVLGDNWIDASQFIQILTPMYAVHFVASSLSQTNNVFERQRLALIWQTGLVIITSLIFFISYGFESILFYLELLSIVMVVYYLALLWILRRVVSQTI